MHLLGRIETFLRSAGMTPTRFGRLAAHDPRLVYDMRNGRSVGPRLAARVIAFIDKAQS